MHYRAPCHNSKIHSTFLECYRLLILQRPGNSPLMIPKENICITMKKEIGNQMPCLKEETWKRVCEAWYSVAPNVLKEHYNSMPRRIAYLIKQRELQ